MSDKPIVSVIIPSFNSANTILRAIHSVQNQTYQNWELIIVDDGSTDNTLELIKPIIDSIKIKLLSQQNLGAGPARNNGVKHAIGKYIAFLDADDEWSPWKLELQLEVAAKVKEFGMITTSAWRVFNDETKKQFSQEKPKLENLQQYSVYDFLRENCCTTPSVLIPQDVFQKLGGFDPKWKTGQDRDFWIKVAYAYPIYHIPIPLIKFYTYSKSLSRRLKYTNLVNRLLINEQWWPGSPDSLDIEGKINPKKYFKIFRAKLYHFEKRMLHREPELANAAWDRFGKVFGHRKNLVFGFLQLLAMIRALHKKERITKDNIPELIAIIKTYHHF
jgi:glycosyltransferase involved in cell wall biosynthesis